MNEIDQNNFKGYLRDSNKAFENAKSKGLNKPEDFMYMYSQENKDFFKNIMDRKYINLNNERGNMKEIIYKGKKVKVPFEDADYTLDGDKDVEIANRFGGEKCTMPGYAAAVYDVILGAEQFKDWDTHRKGLDWFSRNFPKQYMVLLD